jgi:hypothetical protein
LVKVFLFKLWTKYKWVIWKTMSVVFQITHLSVWARLNNESCLSWSSKRSDIESQTYKIFDDGFPTMFRRPLRLRGRIGAPRLLEVHASCPGDIQDLS